ncbi:Legionella secretion system protein A [Legionella lansingensis]|uniref:Legionella secretion system protein A n=1 Tax=Legionella lansingensis TaxID=45067 RepID=A0A0W0VIZ0_9GAMM|nr:L,D-transpeptidase family protein [Legionella lansingensis]KTD20083.1 Legionella secretion system protein A [Legionella lansingensis]SNV51073.1 Legionella secretion system protein A [Legionella lansingensis]
MRNLLLLISFLFSSVLFSMAPKLNWDKAIDKAVVRYGLRTEPELKRFFARSHVAYPPNEVALLAFKKERKLELWAKDDNHSWRYIHTYPLTAFSGRLGPKLRERDGQIPEGIYRLITFNPFSSMHLSMMIDYPNHFDRLQAIKDGRKKLGNNIFLHGKSLSVGCLAVGDWAIDQLFLLARRVGLQHVKVIIAPNDLRIAKPATSNFAQPRWLPDLYKQISTALNQFPTTQKKIIMATK